MSSFGDRGRDSDPKCSSLSASARARRTLRCPPVEPLEGRMLLSVTLQATEGTPLANAVVDSFVDNNGSDPASNYSATIDWGDGSTSGGTVLRDQSNSSLFDIVGTHTYTSVGTDTVHTTVFTQGVGGPPATATVQVADANKVTQGLVILYPTQRATFSGTVATFSDTYSAQQASDFLVRINWGDGTITPGTVVGGNGQFDIQGSHAYAKTGGDSITIELRDARPGTLDVPIFGAAFVAKGPFFGSFVAPSASPTEGTAFSGVVTSFHDPGSPDPASDYGATIDWGDGQTGAGTIVGSGGNYNVDAAHTYVDGGSYPVLVTFREGNASGTDGGTIVVTDTGQLSITPRTLATTEGSPVSGTVASFTDTYTAQKAGDFTATVSWGDGSTSLGQVTADRNVVGQFDVAASKPSPYANYGPETVAVMVNAHGNDVTGQTTTTFNVADANVLTPVGRTIHATKQTAFSGPVATFTDTLASSPSSLFSATIAWGDGSTGVGTVAGTAGTFTVVGAHTYNADGTIPVATALSDSNPGTASATALSSALVAESGVTVKLTPLPASEGTAFSGTIGTFTDPGGTDPASDFTATIAWGDGSSSTGTVSGSAGSYRVAASHTYLDGGYDLATLSIAGQVPGPVFSATGVENVARIDVLTTKPLTISPVQGVPFAGTVATFTDSYTAKPGSDFLARINWGDGSITNGTVVGSAGAYKVQGSHTFNQSGPDLVIIALYTDIPGDNGVAIFSVASIAESDVLQVNGLALSGTEGQPFQDAVVATATDNIVGAAASSFSASIDWGDGSTTVGTVGGSSGSFSITGTHTYLSSGNFTTRVKLSDKAPATASASGTGTAQVALLPPQGSSKVPSGSAPAGPLGLS